MGYTQDLPQNGKLAVIQMDLKRKGQKAYMIRVLAVGGANALLGEVVPRYYCPHFDSENDHKDISQMPVAQLISSRMEDMPKLFIMDEDKEELIITLYELQKRLDAEKDRNKIPAIDKLKAAFAQGPELWEMQKAHKLKREEYFVRPVIFDYNKFLQDCQIATQLCNPTQKKIRQSEKQQKIADRALAKIRGEPYYDDDIDRPD